MINKINGHSTPYISWQYASCSSYFHITLLQSIQIQVPRSIILVTMQTDTQTDTQQHHLHQKKFQQSSTLEGEPLWLQPTWSPSSSLTCSGTLKKFLDPPLPKIIPE